ncbi:peroxiredoxin-like family protein [Chamaesiphon sp.]|uniref:peroxiredoxin-like family protein n=1 Tax=Chamaesiphon sp. TaxID=2814140 RepID=UPI003593C4F4
MTTNTTKTSKLLTGTQVPALEVKTLDGKTWKLIDRQPENLTLIIFYRGWFCPICKTYLEEIDRHLADFAKLGVKVIAVSGDSQAKAQACQDNWQINNLTIGYAASIQLMRDWGLYLSKGAFEHEPNLFCEPGFFLVKNDGTLYYTAINSGPFGRPSIGEMLGSIEFVLAKKYPIRGTEK